MPYRRLPNTNKARLRALRKAIEMGKSIPYNDIPFPTELLREAESRYRLFRNALEYYNQCLTNQAQSNRKHQEKAKKAKLYISHFIQVLNLSVIREEIKSSVKSLYGLEENTHTLPDLSSESSLLDWGKKIIEGEELRMLEGGTPIYNPTIAKVKVLYNIFEESYWVQKNLQRITQQSLDQLSEHIPESGTIILNLWDAIEDKYKNLSKEESMVNCQKFGVVYYFRKKKTEKAKE